MTNYWIQLFINRYSATSVGAEENLNAILKKNFPGDFQLEIIDIQENPEKAEEAGILAIPTLIRKWPQPEVRLIGALTLPNRVLTGLGIVAKEEK